MSGVEGFDLELVRHLECPYCEARFDLEPRWVSADERMHTGVLRCHCQRIPIVSGILIWRRDLAGRFLRIYDESDSPASAAKRAGEQMTTALSLPSALMHGTGAFVETIDRLLPGMPKSAREWPIHAQHWYRTTKYLALLPLLEIVARARPRLVLDIGCGAGHFAFQAVRYSGADTVFGVDRELFHLLAARRWMLEAVPHVCLLCADANEALPLARELVDVVISSDALHYITNKSRAIREIARVRRPGGLTVLSHLHNSLKSNVEMHQGSSLEPGSWRLLFDRDLGADYLLTSDDDLRRAVVGEGRSWQLEDGTLPDLATARSLSLVSGAGPGPMSWQDSVLRTSDLDGDIVNPIYELDPGDGVAKDSMPALGADRDVVRLRRRQLSQSFEYEFASATPPSAAVLDVQRVIEEPDYRERLRRHAILVMAPRRYTASSVANLCDRERSGTENTVA